MRENQIEGRQNPQSALQIFKASPEFARDANDICMILGYSQKFYSEGLLEVYRDGPYKGHATKNEIPFWQDYAVKSLGILESLRQIELHQENKIDKYTGGKSDANYNYLRSHYILWETRWFSDKLKTPDNFHVDESSSMYLYEANTLDSTAPKDQAEELLDSLKVPQGDIKEDFYLKLSRECPWEEFYEACKDSFNINEEFKNIDLGDADKAKRLLQQYSYKMFTDAADTIGAEDYDFARMPNGDLIVMNPEVLINPKEISEIELADSENKRLLETYTKYLSQSNGSIIRGSKEDLEQFTKFLQSL